MTRALRNMTLLVVTAIGGPVWAADAADLLLEGREAIEAWDPWTAAKAARAALDRAPGMPEARWLLGEALFHMGDYDAAVPELEAAAAAMDGPLDESLDRARAVQKETEGSVEAKSDHFVFVYPPGKDAVLAPWALEALEAARIRIGEALGYYPEERVRVEVYGEPAALARVSSLTEEEIRASGTIALCKYNRLMFTSPKATLRGYSWLDTLAHEYAHYVITRKSKNRVPIWVHEGLAKFLETRWRGPAGMALSPSSAQLLRQRAQKGTLIPFADMHPSIAKLPTQDDAALAFAEVFTAMETLHEGRGLEGLRALVEAIGEGLGPEAAIEKAAGMPFSAFDKKWRERAKSRPVPGHAVARAAEAVRFKDDRKAEAEELEEVGERQAKRHLHLGELLRMRGRLEAAAAEYERAVARVSAASSPVLANKLAITLIALGKNTRAEQVLAEALPAAPNYALTRINFARLYLKLSRPEDALEHLIEAVRVNPFDPDVQEMLHAAAKSTGDAATAERAARALAALQN